MNDTNEKKISISSPTAKYLLRELLADDYLLNDREILELLDSALKKNKNSKTKPVYSKIVIDEHCRIFMPEYSHKEIKMPYLPKTVYIFFYYLRVVLNLKIYITIWSSFIISIRLFLKKKNLESEKLKRSLENLVEPLNNRIYEICSLIRRELAGIVPEELLDEYTITGKWGGLHQVRLERSYVQIHDKILDEYQRKFASLKS